MIYITKYKVPTAHREDFVWIEYHSSNIFEHDKNLENLKERQKEGIEQHIIQEDDGA